MTIRTRLSLWYAAVMFTALMVMSVLLYYQLVVEPRNDRRMHQQDQAPDPDEEQDTFEDVTAIVLWCGLPAGALALAGGWWLMRKSLSPVAELTRAARQISSHNLDARLARTRNGDELDQLTEVLNNMLARLDGSFHRIREFTLHASHELKTPLTVLHGELETALREESPDAPQRERLLSELDEVKRLSKIVDGLTLLTKTDSGQVKLEQSPLQLDELVHDAFDDAQILAGPRGLKVELAACETLTVVGDRHRLRQLLLNLADNAIKYNQPQGSVMLGLRRVDRQAELTVINTGPGIPPELLPRVFDRFFRGDASHNSDVDGCGLGLSIAQWIVSAHRGTIRVESVPGQTTTVTVCLPLAESPGQPG
jgi:signal transduction histidine kinase